MRHKSLRITRNRRLGSTNRRGNVFVLRSGILTETSEDILANKNRNLIDLMVKPVI